MKQAIFWHRRDLRLTDNAGLYKACKQAESVFPVFIFDQNILGKLPPTDQRVVFIHREITRLKQAYRDLGSDLHVFFGDPVELLPTLARKWKIDVVFTNRDYEPYARERDKTVLERLHELGCSFLGAKDHVIFEKNEVLKSDGTPYTVFTPYMRKWKEKLNDFFLKAYPNENYTDKLVQRSDSSAVPTLESMGFSDKQTVDFPSPAIPTTVVDHYHETRDIPSVEGTSRLSLHLRFGTISIRELARFAQQRNEKYLNELIWRDFYQMILYHFPHSATAAFRPIYDRVQWENNDHHFAAWCAGKTGYPLVDAGMRELNQTGHMHNRVRMVVASFLTKHLLLDWRLGERYFAEKLLDFELASNAGGWQWAAGSGCDAAPYFRIFNPTSQLVKFDPQLKYVKKWVPEYGTAQYPQPIVEHRFARERALTRYKEALKVE